MTEPTTGRPLHAIARIDRSPMNPKVWVVQLDCGHDIYKSDRKPTTRQKFPCEKCETRS